MKIKDLAEVTNTSIKIKDGKNGKVLCSRYRASKHESLSDREVLGVWSEIDVCNSGYDSFARPVICVYVEHKDGEKNDLRS